MNLTGSRRAGSIVHMQNDTAMVAGAPGAVVSIHLSILVVVIVRIVRLMAG